ncbi:hypothetical protein GQ55_6G176500 [Panicum hallii var. hallii]|uniref:YDG domain-containing protein n=1 Tax=Panicum hallii var. hallii TaxID=1504633 RepID=A0A2T7D703_9POAL|nr:hypothetical protein GQ55_6G176500 [Panicum hallii var. hallii]PUZ51344.1 hypothetical protein GQ55_6G176500 [Panicum hallii var. hallii]
MAATGPAAAGWLERLGDPRGSLPHRRPPPPRAAEGRRGGDAGKAEAAGDGIRSTSRGGAVARSGVVALAGPDADAAGVAGASAGDSAAGVVDAPREGSGGGEVGSKRSSFASAAPRAYTPPKRRLVSATRRFPPGCGRGVDASSRLVAAPAPRPDGGSAASPKPAPPPPPPPPPLSIGEAGSVVLPKVSAAVVPRPVPGGGCHGPVAGALRSPEPSRRSLVAAADCLLDNDPQGGAGRGGEFGSGKQLVPATRLPPKPRTMVSTIRRFPAGCGRVKASQSLNKSADKCLRTESKESSTARGSFGPKKKVVVKDPAHLRLKVASACTMGTINKLDQVVASMLEDDGFLKAIAAYDRKLELKLNVSSIVPSARCQRQSGTQNADARCKVKMMCMRFQFICRAIVQVVEQSSLKISRIDLAADKVIKKSPGFTQHEPVIGNVPGVEVGDEFLYRVELALVGLHRPYQGGIDTTRDENGVLVAISIVASGCYPDELSSSGELVYTGSGGKYAGKKTDENQQLKRGNLALKNCIQMETPVRVIHGFKGLSREEGSHSRAKRPSAFTYDGLYHVLDCWREGQAGSKVFKYKLQRIPGQPELPHCSKTARGS